jgi:hypothetical protein
MANATGTSFSIIRRGELQEESWEWSDIETMARAGRLSTDTLIFLPGENAWKKLIDTDLAACFETPAPVGKAEAIVPVERNEEADDGSLLDEIRANPGDVALRLRAAGLAVAAGRLDEAREHYQRALDASPYHPRAAQEAKRKLPPSKWKLLRYLEKPPPVWEDPSAIFAYARSRGPLYLAVPALALTGLLYSVWTTVPAVLALAFWAAEIIRSTSRGERRAPLGDGLLADPLRRIARPAAMIVLVTAELSAVFIALAGLLIVTHTTGETDVFLVVARSPVLTVIFCTLCLTYCPAVIMLIGASRHGMLSILNPRSIVSVIRRMEVEYLVTVFAVTACFCAMWGIGTLVGDMPVLGRVFYAAGTVFIVLSGGFVLGSLYARFREELDPRPEDTGSRVE